VRAAVRAEVKAAVRAPWSRGESRSESRGESSDKSGRLEVVRAEVSEPAPPQTRGPGVTDVTRALQGRHKRKCDYTCSATSTCTP
jgi:hypothetical protein